MAVTRRGYIFGAFISSVLCAILIVVALASDSWVTSTATAPIQVQTSFLRYGLFRGELTLRELGEQTHTLFMTCVPDMNACALSCKTNEEARRSEVRALADSLRPNVGCFGHTIVDPEAARLPNRPVISFAFYVCFIAILIIQLILALGSAGLTILNATKNPTEPVFGLPGCLWTNVALCIVGVLVMLTFGIYWLVSGLNEHLALSFIALGVYTPGPGLGYSYWLLIAACLCSVTNVCLIVLRGYLLERDPPPPTIKVENHSDGTIFLY